MFKSIQKNIKTLVKQTSNLQSLISAKKAIYFGLVAYWGVIIFGTFFNI